MVDAGDSFAMVRRMKNATALFYGDAGHAFLFQHPDDFGNATLDFLPRIRFALWLHFASEEALLPFAAGD
jgi:hypothetical protein